MSTAVVSAPTPFPDVHKPVEPVEDLEDDGDEVRSNDDDDDAGSLVDFIVDDEGEEGDDEDDDAVSTVSDAPKNKEEERVRDLDGIDASNIITGKRTRRQTKFYEQEVFNTDEYRRMILEDVPEDERHALEQESDDEEDATDDEEEYEEDEEDEEDDEDEEDEEDDDVKKMRV